jgi:hypothetical protein
MSCPKSVKFLIWMSIIRVALVMLLFSYLRSSSNFAIPRVGYKLYPQGTQTHFRHTEEVVVTRFQHLKEVEDFVEAGDRIWKSQLLPPKGGFLWVKTNGTDDIVETEGWGITMFHALHCLQMIRELFKSTMSPEHASNHAIPGHDHADHDLKHATHCLSYLYQVRKRSIYHLWEKLLTKGNSGHHLCRWWNTRAASKKVQ